LSYSKNQLECLPMAESYGSSDERLLFQPQGQTSRADSHRMLLADHCRQPEMSCSRPALSQSHCRQEVIPPRSPPTAAACALQHRRQSHYSLKVGRRGSWASTGTIKGSSSHLNLDMTPRHLQTPASHFCAHHSDSKLLTKQTIRPTAQCRDEICQSTR
jgi:hypothetical protein